MLRMVLRWRLRELMAERDVRSTRDLHRKMLRGRDAVPGLSQAQVYRLADRQPDRLNLESLDELCRTLEVTPAELLTDDVAGVPRRLLSTLLSSVAIATGYQMLSRSAGDSRHLPGDSFGRVVIWLWTSGRRGEMAQLVGDLMAELRVHNSERPEDGSRPIWRRVRFGIEMGISGSGRLSDADVGQVLDYLDAEMPKYYGQSLSELNTP